MAARKPSAPAVDLRSGPGGGTPCHRSALHTRPRRRPTRPPPRREIKLVAGGRGKGPGAAPAPARGSGCLGLPGRRGGRLGEPEREGRRRTGLGPSPPRPPPGGREPPAPAGRRRPQTPVPLGRGRCREPPGRRHRLPQPPFPAVGRPPRASTHRENPPSSSL